jgi:hypothetical protein
VQSVGDVAQTLEDALGPVGVSERAVGDHRRGREQVADAALAVAQFDPYAGFVAAERSLVDGENVLGRAGDATADLQVDALDRAVRGVALRAAFQKRLSGSERPDAERRVCLRCG